MIGFGEIKLFEDKLAELTGAPYAVMTDCCTHAIELCLRYHKIKHTEFTAFTYLSVPMTMHKLGITYNLIDERWLGEYRFYNTNIWDSARRLEKNMYRPGMMQCLSFGHSKPLQLGGGGAILLDDEVAYNKIIRQRYDGRDLNISPWQSQVDFEVGYHYRPTIEMATQGVFKLANYRDCIQGFAYPDCRKIRIHS